MYFSVLPLLILFSSVICASPVHVEHRSNSVSAISISQRGLLMVQTIYDLPHTECDNHIWEIWNERVRGGKDSAWSKHDNAWKMQGEVLIHGVPCTLFEVVKRRDADIASTISQINALKRVGQILGVGWNVDRYDVLRIIFAKKLGEGEHVATRH